jgi:hypothetical protein
LNPNERLDNIDERIDAMLRGFAETRAAITETNAAIKNLALIQSNQLDEIAKLLAIASAHERRLQRLEDSTSGQR